MKNLLSSAAAAAMLAAGAASLTVAPAAAQEPILGELRIMPSSFCPRNWASAEGQLLPSNQYTALFSLIGNTYGGDGRTNFALPDLRGRTPLGEGVGPGLTPRATGQRPGAETVTLTIGEIPPHRHTFRATSSMPDVGSVDGHGWGDFGTSFDGYNSGGPLNETAQQDALANAGGSQPHNNISPTLVIRYCIAMQGIFPQRD